MAAMGHGQGVAYAVPRQSSPYQVARSRLTRHSASGSVSQRRVSRVCCPWLGRFGGHVGDSRDRSSQSKSPIILAQHAVDCRTGR